MDPIRRKIVVTALASRCFIWGLAFVADLLVPNHDAGVFQWTVTPEVKPRTVGDILIGYLTDCLTRWDGQYFLHVANNGYSYENCLAFFPLYPVMVRVVAEVLYWLQVDYGLLHFHSTLKMAGILVNVGLFVGAALALYELSRKLLKDDYLAYKSSLYFCLNPASVFFSATYSESMHAAISFYLMLKVDKGFSFPMAILLALSTAARSNALLNVGFIGYKCLRMISKEIGIHKWLKQHGKQELSSTIASILGDALMPTAFCILAALVPFGLYQWYAFTQYCGLTKPSLDYDQSILDYASNHSLKLPSNEPSVWCSDTLPIPYFYIQSHYWNVGFLRYYTWRQIPNFLLAAPILTFLLWQSWRFFKCHSAYCKRLGLAHFVVDPSSQRVVASFDMYGCQSLPKECFVYVAHAFALTMFCLLFVHVQVSTRMLTSSSPVLYWAMAILTSPPGKKPTPLIDLRNPEHVGKIETPENIVSRWRCVVLDERTSLTKLGLWLQNYFVIYACVGTIMFANFLPWT